MNGGGPLWVFAIGRGIFGAGSSFRVEDVRAIFWKVFASINRILIFFGGGGLGTGVSFYGVWILS